jgi:hypothetical protein
MSSGDESLYRGDPPPPQYGTPPGYAPPSPGYGPPPGYGYPPMYRRPTNQLAIVSLVLAFVIPPAALVVGIVARKQIRQTGEDGDGLALAGVIIGGITTALLVLMILFLVIAFAALDQNGFS